jgi:hypothetical protein
VAVPMLLGGLVFVVGCGGVRVEEMSSAVSLITRRFRK